MKLTGGLAGTLPGTYSQHLSPTPTVTAPTSGGSATQSLAQALAKNILDVFNLTATVTAAAGGSPTLTGSATTGSVKVLDDIVASATSTSCSANATSASGNAMITGLTVDGVHHGSATSPIPPNSVFTAASGGRLVANEQIRNTDGTVTINALHLYANSLIYGKGDIIVGHVVCGINATP